MQDDKAVKVIVIIVNYFYNLCPERWFHVRRIDRWIELIGGDTVVETFQFGNMFEQLVEVEVFKRSGFWVFYHSDSTSGVNQKYRRVICFHKCLAFVVFRAQRYIKVMEKLWEMIIKKW